MLCGEGETLGDSLASWVRASEEPSTRITSGRHRAYPEQVNTKKVCLQQLHSQLPPPSPAPSSSIPEFIFSTFFPKA